MSLDYNSRIRTIAERLNLFLRQFKQPEHLDNPAKIERMKATAHAINARISASSGRAGLEDRLDATFQRVLETYKGRDWPSVAAFTEAARDTAPRDNPRPVQHGDFTTSGLNASRIAAPNLNASRSALRDAIRRTCGQGAAATASRILRATKSLRSGSTILATSAFTVRSVT